MPPTASGSAGARSETSASAGRWIVARRSPTSPRPVRGATTRASHELGGRAARSVVRLVEGDVVGEEPVGGARRPRRQQRDESLGGPLQRRRRSARRPAARARGRRGRSSIRRVSAPIGAYVELARAIDADAAGPAASACSSRSPGSPPEWLDDRAEALVVELQPAARSRSRRPRAARRGATCCISRRDGAPQRRRPSGSSRGGKASSRNVTHVARSSRFDHSPPIPAKAPWPSAGSRWRRRRPVVVVGLGPRRAGQPERTEQPRRSCSAERSPSST